MSSGRTEVKPQTWLCDFLLHCRGENKLQRGGDNFSVSITHLHCKPILPASGAWRGINQNVSLYVVACNVPTSCSGGRVSLSLGVVLTAQLCALKLHRCALLITPSLQSYSLEVDFVRFVPKTFEPLTNVWTAGCRGCGHLVSPPRSIRCVAFFINAHDPKRRSDISSKCYEASNTIWWIVKGGSNIFKNGRDDVQK